MSDTFKDFMGNEIGVGDHIYYCPTDRHAGMVHATVEQIGPRKFDIDKCAWIKVQPHSEAGWKARSSQKVTLTKFDRIVLESRS